MRTVDQTALYISKFKMAYQATLVALMSKGQKRLTQSTPDKLTGANY